MMLNNRTVLVVGLGRSGIAAAFAAAELGAEVSVQDSKPADQIDPQLLRRLDAAHIRCWLGRVPDDMGYYDMYF